MSKRGKIKFVDPSQSDEVVSRKSFALELAIFEARDLPRPKQGHKVKVQKGAFQLSKETLVSDDVELEVFVTFEVDTSAHDPGNYYCYEIEAGSALYGHEDDWS